MDVTCMLLSTSMHICMCHNAVHIRDALYNILHYLSKVIFSVLLYYGEGWNIYIGDYSIQPYHLVYCMCTNIHANTYMSRHALHTYTRTVIYTHTDTLCL